MKGIGVSPGISIGKVFLKNRVDMNIEKKNIIDVKHEISKLNKCITKSIKEMKYLYTYALKKVGKKEAEIFNAHILILEDVEFIGKIKKNIKERNVNAEWAVKEITDEYIKMLKNIENQYLRERISDIRDVSNRLLKNLMDIKEVQLSTLDKKYIIISDDLVPSEAVKITKDKVLGMVTEFGGINSHTSIVARTLELPAVVGVKNITKYVKDDDIIIVDGNEGLVIVNPTEEEIKIYEEKQRTYEEDKAKLNKLKEKESISKDGIKVRVSANIGIPKDVEKVIENDGEGIGLYRTEFLYMNRDKLPKEEEQFKAYKAVAEKLEGKPVVIRTLDIGGDKNLPYLGISEEMNPFLGKRAIRLCLGRKDIFKTQLRAILRAGVYGNIKIMFPMISNIEELRKAKSILEEAKFELRSKNINFNEQIEVGILVEVPSVAIQSDIFAKEVDFFSIGTNDLIQYTVAVDRGNQDVSHLYSQYHPAVLRLIKMTIENAHKEGIWVGVCGEAAGDEKLIPILLGMGLDEFSMSPPSILKARWLINNIFKNEMENMVEEILKLSSYREVEKYIGENITSKFET